MNKRVIYALKFIKYFLFSRHKKGHGIHSPFMFKLITHVFNKKPDKELQQVYALYNQFKKSEQLLTYKEMGENTSYRVKNKLSVGTIIKRSSVNKKYGRLLYNLTKFLQPEKILEIGTSVGISTAFIAKAAPNAQLITIEGIPEKVEVAKKIAFQLELNPDFVTGSFDQLLDEVLSQFNQLDFVFFDGNHTKEATIAYFNKCLEKVHNDTLFIFDDIHWSEEMETAWYHIIENEQVKLSVDLFRMGLIFFKKELSYQHYVIKF